MASRVVLLERIIKNHSSPSCRQRFSKLRAKKKNEKYPASVWEDFKEEQDIEYLSQREAFKAAPNSLSTPIFNIQSQLHR